MPKVFNKAIVLIGCPCSGKSTISKSLQIKSKAKFLQLDDNIKALAKKENIKSGETLTNNFIDQATSELMSQLREIIDTGEFAICEIPYHDYVSLLENNQILGSCRLICLYAPLEVLKQRNNLRELNKQIPEEYIDRCFHSVNFLLKSKQYSNITFFNTAETNVDEITSEL